MPDRPGTLRGDAAVATIPEQLAGWLTREGQLERESPLAESEVPPEVWIDGEWLVWSIFSPDGPHPFHRARDPQFAMLRAFVALGRYGSFLDTALERGFAAAVLAFARAWGVLELCSAHQPIGHGLLPTSPGRLLPPPPPGASALTTEDAIGRLEARGALQRDLQRAVAGVLKAVSLGANLGRALDLAAPDRVLRLDIENAIEGARRILGAGATAQEVLAVVREEAAKPIASHDLVTRVRRAQEESRSHACGLVEHGGGGFCEWLGAWLHYARQAGLILKIADSLDRGHTPSDEELAVEGAAWREMLGRRAPWQDPPGFPMALELQARRDVLMRAVNDWLRLGGARTIAAWDHQHDVLDVTLGGRLFASLAVQLMMVVGRADGVAICRNCIMPYRSEVRPGPTSFRCCPDCEEKQAPARLRQRAHRARRDAAAARDSGVDDMSTATRNLLLSDAAWAAVAPLLPVRPRESPVGRSPVTDRQALTGVLYILAGESLQQRRLAWDDLPAQLGCGSGDSCRGRLAEWRRSGLWPRLSAVLRERLPDPTRFDWARADSPDKARPSKPPSMPAKEALDAAELSSGSEY